MDYQKSMSQVIEYLESKMCSHIDLEKAARFAGYSLWEFQRVFSFLTGTTVGVYIRRRKLSLAAQDILLGNEKITDIALKYGYESPTAFSRAFGQLFGVSPSSVRSKRIPPDLYPKFTFNFTQENREEFKMEKKFTIEEKEKCLPIIQQIVALAELTREQGVLMLEAETAKPEMDPLLKVAIKLITDGIEPMLVKGILENILTTEQYEGYDLLKGQIIAEGALSIQAGENPRLIEIKLATFLGLDYVLKATAELEKHEQISLEDYYSTLKKKEIPKESEPFESLFCRLSNRDIQSVLKETDQRCLEHALKTCGEETVRRMMSNLSRRLGGQILRGMKEKPDNLEASTQAQKKIIAVYERNV